MSELDKRLLDALLPALDQLLAEKKGQEPPEPFVDWLLTKAKTEVGQFPDWPFVREYAEALATGKDIIVLKRRQILASWITAAYTHYLASRFPFRHSAVVSSGKREAQKQARRIKFVAKEDGYDLRGVEFLAYPNGSEVSVLPSTQHAGIGESLGGVLHMDEFSKHPYGEENLNAARPGVSNSSGQIVITSTTHEGMGEAGAFYDVWIGDRVELSEDPNFREETPTEIRLFFGRDVRPDQSDEFIEAERNRPGMNDDVISAYYPRTPQEAFTSRAGLVYPQFYRPRHVAPESRPYELEWGNCPWKIVGIDPGGRDPAGLLAMGVYPASPINPITIPGIKGQWRHHIYKEWRTDGAISAYDIRDWVRDLGRVTRIYIGETGGSTLVETLQDMGLPAYKPDMSKEEGIGYVRWLLENDYLTFSPHCPNLLEEFGQYWVHKPRETMSPRANTFATATPANHHADLLDALRYACMGVFKSLPREGASIQQATRSNIRWERAG